MTTYRITNTSNVYFPGFDLDLAAFYGSREDAEDAISEAVIAYNAKVGSGGPDLDIVESSKDAVSEWHTVTAYGSTYDTEDGTGACDVEVQVGEDGGLFYLRTQDDAGGSDEADDTAYPTHAAARKAGLALAKEQDECNDLGADAWLAKQASEAAVEDDTDDVDAALDEIDTAAMVAADEAEAEQLAQEEAEETARQQWDGSEA